MADPTLFGLIFEEILKIDPSILAKYTTVTDQLLYLILIPHVILFLFIYGFSSGIVGRIVGGHTGFKYLMGIVVYIFIILGGWYGSILVPIFINWFYIVLVVGIIIFLMMAVIHPARGPSWVKNIGELGKMAGRRTFGKAAEKKAIEDEIKILRAERESLRRQLGQELRPQAKTYIQMQITEVERRIAQLEAKKRRL